MNVDTEVFGSAPDGRAVDLYTLSNRGMAARITNYGGALVSLEVPDQDGTCADAVLGFDTLAQYVSENSPYFGATIGRYAGDIVGARFSLNGIEYALTANNGANHLHGGFRGFDKVVWDAEETTCPDGVGVKLTYLSRDDEEGHPGNLAVTVVYTLTSNELRISYEAETDKATPVSLTNHSYFNLAGHDQGDILAHELMIDADQYNPAGPDLAPTGEIAPVAGTPLDFTRPTAIGARIGQVPGGYDHNYAVNRPGDTSKVSARVSEPESGRVLEICTTEPGIQLYTANLLDGTIKGKGGAAYQKHAALCLETQQFPDAPNQPHFPPAILQPGGKYVQDTTYRFLVSG